MTYNDALNLMQEYTKSDALRKHMYAVESAMPRPQGRTQRRQRWPRRRCHPRSGPRPEQPHCPVLPAAPPGPGRRIWQGQRDGRPRRQGLGRQSPVRHVGVEAGV